MKSYSTRDIMKILKADGWFELPQKATDHKQFKHATKPGKVTVPNSKDLSIKVIKSIEKQAGIELE